MVNITIPAKVGKRIKTVNDLNNLYAYIEREGGEGYEYEFKGISDKKLMDYMGYEQGNYNPAIIKKILKNGGLKICHI